MKKESVSLTEGPIARGLIAFAFPIFLSNLFQQLYNSIDAAVVGSFAGDEALAAVGSTGSLINLLIGLFLGLATGAGILYSMHYGAGDWQGLKKIIDGAMFLSAATGAAISVLGFIFSRPMLVWVATPDNVLDLSVSYLRIYLAGTVITMIYNVGAGLLRAEGDSRRPLLYLVAGGLTNLVLDLLFVAVFDMGVTGAALATVLAQLVSAVLVVRRLMRLDERYRFRPLHLKLDGLTLWDLTRISVPCGLQSSMFNIANLLVQADINSFGSVAMAGCAAYSKIDGFIYMPTSALSLALSTYVGQNIGAGKYSRIGKGIRTALLAALAMVVLTAGCVLLFCRQLIGLFTTDADAQAFAIKEMWFLAPFAWTFVFSDIFGGAIRGAGDAMKVTVVSASCICVFRVVWLVAMLHFFRDIRVVFVCYPLSWILSSIAMTLLYLCGNGMRKTMKKSAA